MLRARAQTLAENTTSTGYQELIGNTVTATFGSGATARAAASNGTINLNVPNLGVSTFETVQQEDGKRVCGSPCTTTAPPSWKTPAGR